MRSLPRLFKGSRGYAFEIVSPEEDVILVHAENDVRIWFHWKLFLNFIQIQV